MPWWSWVLIWLVLIVGALAVLALIGLSLWRRTMALIKELGVAAERFSALDAQLERLNEAHAQDPAIFDDPVRLRQERARAARGRAAARSARGRHA